MFIGDKIKYTPEVTQIVKGEPVEASVEAVSAVDSSVVIALANGEKLRVGKDLCEAAR